MYKKSCIGTGNSQLRPEFCDPERHNSTSFRFFISNIFFLTRIKQENFLVQQTEIQIPRISPFDGRNRLVFQFINGNRKGFEQSLILIKIQHSSTAQPDKKVSFAVLNQTGHFIPVNKVFHRIDISRFFEFIVFPFLFFNQKLIQSFRSSDPKFVRIQFVHMNCIQSGRFLFKIRKGETSGLFTLQIKRI
ncbi:hypothetical protein D3C80_1581070 [compost metagenome]